MTSLQICAYADAQDHRALRELLWAARAGAQQEDRPKSLQVVMAPWMWSTLTTDANSDANAGERWRTTVNVARLRRAENQALVNVGERP